VYNILVGKPGGKRPLGRPRRRCEDNITMDLRWVGWEDMDWIHMAEDSDQWQALVKTVMNLQVPEKAGDFVSRVLLASEGLCSMQYEPVTARNGYVLAYRTMVTRTAPPRVSRDVCFMHMHGVNTTQSRDPSTLSSRLVRRERNTWSW